MTDATLSRAPDRVPSPVALSVFAVIAVWFVTALAGGISGAFVTPAGVPPWPILIAVALPVAVFGLLYRLMPALRVFVLSIDLRRLVLLHTWRFVGTSFLFLSFYGVLPPVFAIPSGVGDFLVAAGALLVAIALYSPTGASRRLVLGWNSFGLLDFLVAVGAGTLAGRGEILHALGTVPSAAMQTLPLSIIPTFFVPLFVISHLIVYFQLHAHWKGKERIVMDR